MEFDKSKVYTALNADESLIGAKGYFADDLYDLEDKTIGIFTLKSINQYHFESDECDGHFNFFYLVEPAPEKWYVYKNINGVYGLCNFEPKEAEIVFEGTKIAAEVYYEEHSKPKYRPFKDCDELISYFCNKHSILNTDWGLPFIWVKDKADGDKWLITEIFTNAVTIGSDNEVTRLEELFEDYTFLDGSVCGVEEYLNKVCNNSDNNFTKDDIINAFNAGMEV